MSGLSCDISPSGIKRPRVHVHLIAYLGHFLAPLSFVLSKITIWYQRNFCLCAAVKMIGEKAFLRKDSNA